jgi:hypothetical protein
MTRKTTIILLTTLLASIAAFAWWRQTGGFKRLMAVNAPKVSTTHPVTDKIVEKLRTKASAAKEFVSKNGYNENIVFLIDMSLPSGQNRFFIYDLKKDSLRNKGLVTHGRCNLEWLEGRKYGNTVGCGCTSLGKYKIGYSYNGTFGLAFKLYGLEKTNSNAFARFVVLHGHDCVPDSEITDDICQSDGCPTVAPGYLQQLKPIIKESKKPVLLWIFE